MENALLLGIGGAGVRILERIVPPVGVRRLALDTSRHMLGDCADMDTLLLGPRICKGQSAAGPALGRKATEASRVDLAECMCGADCIHFIAALGGGTGTGALPVLLGMARSLGKTGTVSVLLPFRFEHERRVLAWDTLRTLSLDRFTRVTHDNSLLFETVTVRSSSLETAMLAVNDRVAQAWLASV